MVTYATPAKMPTGRSEAIEIVKMGLRILRGLDEAGRLSSRQKRVIPEFESALVGMLGK